MKIVFKEIILKIQLKIFFQVGTKVKNLLFVVEKIGPYHNSRFNNLSKSKEFKIFVVETNSKSKKYLWEELKNINYTIYKLKKNQKGYLKFEDINYQIIEILSQSNPQIIFITGWYEKTHHFLIYKSYFRKIPIVILSDSRYRDDKRIFYKELIKRILLKSFSSGIVAGKESADYLMKLNFNKSAIFRPYNVVDNNYFLKPFTTNKNIYSNYFLCIARFIKVKNYKNLLRGFEIYKEKSGNLNLLIIGSGPEAKLIKEIKNKSKYSNSIFLESWKKTSLLPQYYKEAKATVLASTKETWGLVINESMASGTPCIVSKNCGCYLDLIKEGETGWGFDPNDEIELSNVFLKVEKINQIELRKMKNNIKSKIKKFSLDNFKHAVEEAIENSLKNRRSSLISSILAYILFALKI